MRTFLENKIQKLIIFAFGILLVLSSSTLVLTSQVNAQPTGTGTGSTDDTNLLCKLFPFIQDIGFADSLCGGDVEEQATNTVDTVESLVRFALSLIFIGIIAVAVFTIIKAAIKYIRSEGDEAKIGDSQKAIKAVFMGVAALLVGIIGLIIILAVFDAGSAVDQEEENPLDEFFGG